MNPSLRRYAGVLLIVLPTVMYGGVSLLQLLTSGEAGYIDNPVRQNLWRAGHAHAAVLLLLSLISILLAEHAVLSRFWKSLAVVLIPLAALLMPAAFFFSVPHPTDTHPNGLIVLAYFGALSLATGVLILGVGLIRHDRREMILGWGFKSL